MIGVGTAPAAREAGALDAHLPLLDTVMDPEEVKGALGRGLRGDVLEVTGARVIGLQKGARALLAYDVAQRDGRRVVVYGKHYAARSGAARLMGTLIALEAEVAQRGLGFAVPRPLGWDRELNLVLYLPVHGFFLDDAIMAGDGASAARLSGARVAQLHSCRPPLDRRFDARREAANLRVWARLVDFDGLGGGMAGELAEDFARGVGRLKLSTAAPIHKDLHHRHLIVRPAFAFIDLDEMRWGDPSFDVAHVCVYLELLRMRRRLSPSHVALLQDAFVGAYAECTGYRLDERFYLFAVYACLKIATQLRIDKGISPTEASAGFRRSRSCRSGDG
jgi:hypothetical protein